MTMKDMWPFCTQPPFDIIKWTLGLCWSHVAGPSGWSLIRNMGWLGVFLSPLNWMLHKVTPKGKKNDKKQEQEGQNMMTPAHAWTWSEWSGIQGTDNWASASSTKVYVAIACSEIHKENKLSSKVPTCSKRKLPTNLPRINFVKEI